MALPAFSEARPFYRAAFERFEDAEFLYQVRRNTASVYLASSGGRIAAFEAMIAQRNDQADPVIDQIARRLAEYEREHPPAEAEIYRQNPVSIRIRVIDPRFAGADRIDREEEVWRYLEVLPEETLADVTMLLVLTPPEAETSIASYDFEHPLPSRL